MAEFQKKQSSRKILHSPLVLFVFLCVLLLFMYNMIGLIEKANETDDKKDLTLAQIQSLEKREASLKLNIDKLNTESGAEETLRDKYHLVKEGEKMVVIVDEGASAKDAVATEEKKGGFVNFFKNLFK